MKPNMAPPPSWASSHSGGPPLSRVSNSRIASSPPKGVTRSSGVKESRACCRRTLVRSNQVPTAVGVLWRSNRPTSTDYRAPDWPGSGPESALSWRNILDPPSGA
jgi:hypothetical protein